MKDDAGDCVAIIGVQNDVTERVTAKQKLAQVQRTERRRLARDLHDTVAQDLQALSLRLALLDGEADPAVLRREVAALAEAVHRTAAETR